MRRLLSIFATIALTATGSTTIMSIDNSSKSNYNINNSDVNNNNNNNNNNKYAKNDLSKINIEETQRINL